MNLRECRKRADLTQARVAEVMGISEQAYGCWERETRNFNFCEAIQLADLFGCSLDDLAGRNFRVAEIVPMPETPMHVRLRSAFERLNRDGREYLASQVEAMLKVPAFCDEASRPFASAPATA